VVPPSFLASGELHSAVIGASGPLILFGSVTGSRVVFAPVVVAASHFHGLSDYLPKLLVPVFTCVVRLSKW
jgi:hypothetical protein